ncbi:MAG: T9SS type A sorting domain-containing protein [Ignavibacteria bacterium]|nr:T9SS type A sorting domain-containing protein [Ignavibacteria bacterium]
MRKKLQYLFLLSMFLCSNLFAQGLNSIVTLDGTNVIAVGDNGNILRSSNGGNTWSKNIVAGYSFKCVAAYDSTVWAACSNGKVIRTKPGNNPLTILNVSVNSINSICAIDNLTAFVCGNNGEVYRTTNYGANWDLRNSGISFPIKLNSISFKDALNGVVVGDGGYIYTTANGGTTWTLAATPTTRNLLKVKYFATGICAVGEYGVLLMKAGAGNFTAVNTRILTDIRGVSGIDFNNVKVCGGGGFIRNNSGGNSKFLNFEVNPMMANLVDIFYLDANTGYAVSSLNDAIIKTTNGGQNWNLTGGATATYTWVTKLTASGSIGNTLCPHPNNRDAMFVVYNTGIYRSSNRGENWTQIGTIAVSGLTLSRTHSFYVNPIDTNIMVAASESSPNDVVVKSTNYGANWTVSFSKNFSSYGQPLEQDQNAPNRYYFVPDGGGFYKSTDYGSTFTQVSTYPFLSPCDIVVMYDSANVLYVGESSPSRVYKSTDSGANWTLVLTSSGSEIPSIANSIFDKTQAYATTFSSPLWKTTNYGDNWTQVYTLTGSGWGSDICREDPNFYLTGTYSGSTGYKTTNGGASFFTSSITTGAGAGIIVMEKAYMLAQQTTNLQKLSISYNTPTSIEETTISNSIPAKYGLYQNYPNPFNPATVIKFDLVKNGYVKLVVYNEVGKEVETLLSAVRNAGTYEVKFDASALSSGVYFYKLETESGSFTKKMLLVK